MRCGMVFLSFFVLLWIAVIWSIKSGSVDITVKDILGIVLRRDDSNVVAYNVIWKIRLPRIMLSILLGGALSLSGFLIQTFFRNPIAGPFVLGISSGVCRLAAVPAAGPAFHRKSQKHVDAFGHRHHDRLYLFRRD